MNNNFKLVWLVLFNDISEKKYHQLLSDCSKDVKVNSVHNCLTHKTFGQAYTVDRGKGKGEESREGSRAEVRRQKYEK